VIFDQVPVMLFGHPDGLVPEQLRHIGQLHTPHHQMRPHTLPQRVEPAPLDPGTRPETSENDERAWREAATVLQPLIDWTHRVKSLNPPELRRIANPDSVCGQ